MRLDQMRESENVEDRRGMRGGGPKLAIGGVGGVVLVVIYLLMGGNPQQLLSQLGSPGGGTATSGSPAALSPAQEKSATLVKKVLGDTEDVWTDLFRAMGKQYQPPTLVMFTEQVDSGCGLASAAVGPFYCPADQKVYIDLGFFDELSQRFGAPGDFSQAYVIAHEVGHHVQNLLGTSDQVNAARGKVSEKEYNELSVRLELQADFLAGVWAHHAGAARNIIEAGDVDEALRCANAIGDDTLQRRARGRVVPDSFTHGTSEQRARWFKKGLETGDVREGDTFKAGRL
ncbi:MAG: neutral zinc metallopeptidase [Planctomycetes bacterium]|nr:neutral zinc metallopeptidase [Planctomycetota bacterium]